MFQEKKEAKEHLRKRLERLADLLNMILVIPNIGSAWQKIPNFDREKSDL